MHGNKLPGPPPSFPHKLSPCPSRMAGRLAGLGARYTSHTGQLGAQGSRGLAERRQSWGRLGAGWHLVSQPRAPRAHQGHRGRKGTPARYAILRTGTASLPLPITSASWHGLPCTVFSFPGPSCKSGVRVTMSSPPESNLLQHRWHRAQRTTCMHATPAADASSSTGSLARSLAHSPVSPVFSPSEVSRPARVPLSRFPVIDHRAGPS